MYKVILSRQAAKDVNKLKETGLAEKARFLIGVVSKNPFQNPPPYERLSGNLENYYSRRINIQHRFVYQVLQNTDKLINENNAENNVLYVGIVHVLRMWTHYE